MGWHDTGLSETTRRIIESMMEYSRRVSETFHESFLRAAGYIWEDEERPARAEDPEVTERRKQVLKLWESGISLAEAARSLNYDESTIKRDSKALGISWRRKGEIKSQ